MFGEKKNNIYNVNDDDGGFHITIIIITKQINNNREKYILPTCLFDPFTLYLFMVSNLTLYLPEVLFFNFRYISSHCR